MRSPINPHRFVTYRGSQTKDYFETPSGATKNAERSKQIFQNVGFFSTTLMVDTAKRFSDGKYISRIIVPAGYHCLYLEPIAPLYEEREILMPDQTQYYITSGFQKKNYGPRRDVSDDPIDEIMPTNELVLVQTTVASLKLEESSQHPIRNLILDPIVKGMIYESTDQVLSPLLDIEDYDYDHAHFQYLKIWLRRLVDHQIYDLNSFMTRGKQLQPLTTDVE